jgi:hypothetical protein
MVASLSDSRYLHVRESQRTRVGRRGSDRPAPHANCGVGAPPVDRDRGPCVPDGRSVCALPNRRSSHIRTAVVDPISHRTAVPIFLILTRRVL